mmetsp:Transcript_115753/g.321851  ORF Transcript_115753/g.321851 Transcript_115753/m.321851 type:complete len:243 (+) Transcript_115753:254-982(+)
MRGRTPAAPQRGRPSNRRSCSLRARARARMAARTLAAARAPRVCCGAPRWRSAPLDSDFTERAPDPLGRRRGRARARAGDPRARAPGLPDGTKGRSEQPTALGEAALRAEIAGDASSTRTRRRAQRPHERRASAPVESSLTSSLLSSSVSALAKLAEPMPDMPPAHMTTPESLVDHGAWTTLKSGLSSPLATNGRSDSVHCISMSLGWENGFPSSPSSSRWLPCAVLWMIRRPATMISTHNQ